MITLIFNRCDISLLSPINFSWQLHVTRFQVGRTVSLGLFGKVASHSQVKEAVLILGQISKVVHGQDM